MDENTSQTTPGGALTPPQLQQHTAVAASAPHSPRRLEPGRVSMRESLRGLLDAVLDRLDVAADRIADAAGLR
jgi:hypothetical protein